MKKLNILKGHCSPDVISQRGYVVLKLSSSSLLTRFPGGEIIYPSRPENCVVSLSPSHEFGKHTELLIATWTYHTIEV